MKLENWLTVAIIITNIMLVAATLCAILFSDWIKSRISQPTPTPEIKQPRNLVQRILLWFGRHVFWVLLISIAVQFVSLFLDLRHHSPPTKLDVVLIAFSVGYILFCFLFMLVAKLGNGVWTSIDALWAAQKDHIEIELRVIEILQTLSDTDKVQSENLIALQELTDLKINAAPNTTIDKMLSAIKRLLD